MKLSRDLDPALIPGEQRRAATWLCAAASVLAAGFLPIAHHAGPVMPGFMLIDQTALIAAYGLSAWVLFAQFRRDPTLPVILVAGGTFYTALIVLLQLLSLPGVVAGGRVLGAGPETTTWLWTFWHIGPPAYALCYAATIRSGLTVPLSGRGSAVAVSLGVILPIVCAGVTALLSTAGLPWLPHQVSGDDYTAMVTSGVGPAIQILTVLALAAVWWAIRSRPNVLGLWFAVALGLLILDNFLTMAGAARGSFGWYAGRILAVASAFVILWAYLQEVDTLRARAEASAREAARVGAALRQAQKMEAIGRLTGGIAHDFNNLLMVVTSGFEMIRRRPDDRARVIKMAEAGLEAAERGARLTRQLLTFARRQTLRPETLNLNASLLEFEPLAKRALGETVAFEMALHPALHPTLIDPGEFESAVLNLVVNARDAMPPRAGRIAVGTRNAKRNGPVLTSGGESLPGGDYVVIAVTDNGCGMDEATLAQAFEPFFTTKEFGKGSGLGLSQVYGFARGAGGTVEIASAPGRGTRIEIWLPRAETVQKKAPRLVPMATLRLAQAGETVLAVEDEPAVLSVVAENLADLGYRVIPARDAAEALALLQAGERVDILLSDVVMPGGMNGVELAGEARRQRPGLRVVLTSGYTHEALTGEHSIPPDVPVLTKPYRREELAERLKAG